MKKIYEKPVQALFESNPKDFLTGSGTEGLVSDDTAPDIFAPLR